jgi:PPK2 family polyphosphate:nucleotide phosphotransferase
MTPDPAAYVFPPDGRLADVDPADTRPFADEDEAREATEALVREIARRQHMLAAHGTQAVLVLFQGMDASGKDEAIHHVMAALDPLDTTAAQFTRPEGEDAEHDYLWRAFRDAPPRGAVGVFNRSYYEEVVGERVHPERLDEQAQPARIQRAAADGSLWDERLRQIADVERYWHENGVEVVKLFLHVSKEEQRQRLIERTEQPEKRWDFSRADVTERAFWDENLAAYEAAFRSTSTDASPWYVVPADAKWAARAAVAAILAERLGALHNDFPEPDDELRETLDWARRELGADEHGAAGDA